VLGIHHPRGEQTVAQAGSFIPESCCAAIQASRRSSRASVAAGIAVGWSRAFAAAGAGDYPLGRFLAIVTVCRGARYFTIAFVAGHYGRHFLRVLRHPTQHWGWIAVAVVLAVVLLAGGILASRRLEAAGIDNTKTGVQSPAI